MSGLDGHPAAKRRRRWRRLAAATAMLLVVAVIGVELIARFHLGLGDPPLAVADPEIEYLMRPGDYRRFGRRVFINSVHMRSPEHHDLDVLVMGDSVIFGGSLTDQRQLATSLLAERTGAAVGNVSAGSWGPGNLLAYAERFGFRGAETVVLVMSDHDAGDVRTFRPVVGVHPSYPARSPWSALVEGATRYLPRYLGRGGVGPAASDDATAAPAVAAVRPEAMDAAERLVAMARAADARVLLALHRTRSATGTSEGRRAWRDFADRLAIPCVELDVPPEGYRDDIHPNPAGQRTIAEQLEALIAGDPAGDP